MTDRKGQRIDIFDVVADNSRIAAVSGKGQALIYCPLLQSTTMLCFAVSASRQSHYVALAEGV